MRTFDISMLTFAVIAMILVAFGYEGGALSGLGAVILMAIFGLGAVRSAVALINQPA